MNQAHLDFLPQRKTTTHCQRLAEHFMAGKRIDPLQSWRQLGIYRLASRICDLRQGKYNNIKYNIQGKRIPVINQFGESCWVMEYYIEPIDIARHYKERQFR